MEPALNYNCRLLVNNGDDKPRSDTSLNQTRRVTKENPSTFTEGLQEIYIYSVVLIVGCMS
jgi:hypothetical protein